MAVVAFVGSKGGCGKTTSSILVADAWFARGLKVLLVDADAQGSASVWHRTAREAGYSCPDIHPFGSAFDAADPKASATALWSLSENYDVTVVDCPPGLSTIVRVVLEGADIAVIPCSPSVFEVAMLAEALDLVDAMAEMRWERTTYADDDGEPPNGLDGLVLFTGPPPPAARERFALRLLSTRFDENAQFQRALATGLGATRFAPESTAASQVAALVEELGRRLEIPARSKVDRRDPGPDAGEIVRLVVPVEGDAPVPAVDEAEVEAAIGQPLSRFGDYALLEHLSSNPSSDTHTAEDRDGRLMILRRSRGSSAVANQLVEDEAALHATLDHQNVIQFRASGEIDRCRFLATEYLDGLDLLAVLAKCGRLRIGFPTDIALHIVTEVLSGLAYLADRGVTHGGVAHRRVILSYRGVVKLSNFSCARTQPSSSSDPYRPKGIAGYQSPEQIVESPFDARSDVFSVGILLYECLTGRRLFSGRGLNQLERNRDVVLPAPLRSCRPDLADELERITMTALARHPAGRFQTAEALRSALSDYLYQARAAAGAVELARFLQRLVEHDEVVHRRRRSLGLPPLGN